MQIVILGKEESGTKDFFEIITHGKTSMQNKKLYGSVSIPDQRVDDLSAFFKPKKTTYSQLTLFSVDMNHPGYLEEVKAADLIVYVVKAFSAFEGETFNPLEEMDNFITSIKIKDIEILERFIQKHKKDLSKAKEVESAEELLSEIELSGQVKKETVLKCEFLKHTMLLSALPLFFVLNRDENEIQNKDMITDIEKKFPGYPVFPVSTKIEKELMEMDKEAYEEFLTAYQIEKPALDVLIQEIFQNLGLMTFFTVGEDEVRAWTIKTGINAYEASGKIHTDIQKGFIRAEIVHYKDFSEHHFSFKEAKEKGVFFLEGKEYILHDGDIMHVRFNL